ncbi:unnamed protein product [Heterosigma akashiwo]
MSANSKELQNQIIEIGARTNRGELQKFSALGRGSILPQIKELEDECPEFEPSDLIGEWDLIYSNTYLFRSSPFFMAARAVCKDGVEAERFNWFCKQHREALIFTQIGRVSQTISEGRLVSEFESRVPGLPGLPVIIKGTIQSSADYILVSDDEPSADANTSSATCLELHMDRVRIKQESSNIPLVSELLNLFEGLDTRAMSQVLEERLSSTGRGYTTPRPRFRTTYLDPEAGFRVGRDQDDNAFVYLRR